MSEDRYASGITQPSERPDRMSGLGALTRDGFSAPAIPVCESGLVSGLVVAVAPTLAGEQQQDAVARTVLNNAPPVWSSNDLVANNTGTTGLLGTAENLFKSGLAAGGVLTASALFSVTMTAVLQALPMVQALLLLGVYALLPLVVVLSRYSLSMMVVGAMAIFTVKFWSVLWYLAMWVDQNLIQSMYPDVNAFLQIFANPGEHDTKRMLLLNSASPAQFSLSSGAQVHSAAAPWPHPYPLT